MAATTTIEDFEAASESQRRFQDDAEAVAREYGHVLGEWYSTGGLRIAARCTQCTATACLKRNGSNNDPLRWLADRECSGPLDRFYVAKSKVSGIVHYVRDRTRPQYGPVLMAKKSGPAVAEAKRLNALHNGEAPVDELAVKRAKVDRLRTQLAKAEAELAAVAA